MSDRTYRYIQGNPMYSFGYGLSYSTFFYSNLNIRPYNMTVGQDITVEVFVNNQGPYDGEEVYITFICNFIYIF